MSAPSRGLEALFLALGFAAASLLMRAAVRVYFRSLRVRHVARFPRTGPVLVIANHPAMWTDVLVLDVALGRKLHFLALGRLFKPFARAILLELHGALPVIQSPGGTARATNEETFRRCRELFARGDVVALFPEGVSEADRSVLELKTGAARLALEAARDPADRERMPAVIPIGIHYADRTSYGTEVTVSVGQPIELAPFRALERTDPERAVHELTEHMRDELRSLILDLPEPALAAAVSDLEPLAGLSRRRGARELESAQRIASRLDQLRLHDPERFEAIRRHSRAYGRARRALGLSDRALAWDRASPPWRRRASLLALLCVLGAPVAALGSLLHVAPWGVGELVAHGVGRDPARLAFGRIASGIVLFPATDLTLFLVLVNVYDFPPGIALGMVLVVMAIGLWTLQYMRWAYALWERARLVGLEWRQPRLVRRARAEQRLLLRLVTEAAGSRTPANP